MKVLSIQEPYATLIKIGVKKIETRSWKTNYRGRLYIHASLTKIKNDSFHCQEVLDLLENHELNYGSIICSCDLVDCVEMTEEFIEKKKKNKEEYICGIYEKGRYGWILENIEVLESPIPVKGHLGLWNMDFIE